MLAAAATRSRALMMIGDINMGLSLRRIVSVLGRHGPIDLLCLTLNLRRLLLPPATFVEELRFEPPEKAERGPGKSHMP